MHKAIIAAAAIPVLGLAALVVRAEVKVRLGVEWLIGIEGYDPRDLLSGHFLRYRYAFNWDGTDTCGGEVPEDDGWPPRWDRGRSAVRDTAAARSCCVCLTRRGDGLIEPSARLASCEEATTCDGSLRVADVTGPQKYFVPEDRATELETALRGREAAVVLSVPRGDAPAVKELYLDRRPWREALGQ
jgi:hypothetical protein